MKIPEAITAGIPRTTTVVGTEETGTSSSDGVFSYTPEANSPGYLYGGEHMIDGKELGNVGFQYLGVPYSTMDCQEFVEKCLADCGWKVDLKGSNAWYRKCRQEGWVGTPEECVRKYGTTPDGAFLFIHAFDGGEEKVGYHDGLGNASHIGLCTGSRGKGAIHSSSTRGCVAESEYHNKSINGGWNMVGLLPREIDYHNGDQPEPSPEPTPEPEPVRRAVVWSENGKPVNTRKGPDESYDQSKAGKLDVGTVVDVLKTKVNSQGEEWCWICCQEKPGVYWYCWIKACFLRMDEPEPSPDPGGVYTVHIPYLTEYQAEALMNRYPGSWKTK